MYVDTAHNSPATAYANVYRALLVVALKFQAYVQEWGVNARRKSGFLYSEYRVPAIEWRASTKLTSPRSRRRRQTTCSRSWRSNGPRS